MEVKLFCVDAFVFDGKGGNTAGVVPDAGGMSDSQMQGIASKLGFSETVFLSPSANGGFRARFFTPVAEISLCGHATIAAAHIVFDARESSKTAIRLDVNLGSVEVSLENGLIFMTQANPVFYGILEPSEVARALRIVPEELVAGLPLEIVSTGAKDVMVPVANLAALKKIAPDLDKISEICRKNDCVGFHAFTRETIRATSSFSCRNFAPLYGINEESATGTSNGALAAYSFKHGLLGSKANEALEIEQGFFMGKPSLLTAKLETKRGKIEKVRVGGRAKTISQTTLKV